MMAVHPSGYYAWRARPDSPRVRSDQRLRDLIKQFWLDQVPQAYMYGYRKITDDLRDEGDTCGKHRVYRLMRAEGLRSQTGYRRRQGSYGKPAVVAPNRLAQQFDAQAPNQSWVTDITYIRTHEGWLYLAVLIDLFSRQVIGWSMQSRMETDLLKNQKQKSKGQKSKGDRPRFIFSHLLVHPRRVKISPVRPGDDAQIDVHSGKEFRIGQFGINPASLIGTHGRAVDSPARSVPESY